MDRAQYHFSCELWNPETGKLRARELVFKMQQEVGKQIRIGELLMEAGIVEFDYIRNALQNFEQRGLPIGKVLVMSGYLTENQLRTALEVQSLVNDGLLPLSVAIQVLQIAHKDKVALADAFQASGFVQPEDQQTNKLGQLLVGAGIVDSFDLDEALQTNIRTGLPLGHIFCFRGAVSQSLIWTGLLCQQMIRKGVVSREMAIMALQEAREREIALEKLQVNSGFQRLPMKPTPKLGELLTEAKLIDPAHLNDALHRSLLLRKGLGTVLISQYGFPQEIIDACIDLQEMIDNGTLSTPLAVEALVLMRENSVPMAIAIAEVGAYKPQANKAVALVAVLTSSGATTLANIPHELQECLTVNYNQARRAVQLFLELEVVSELMVYSALRCVYLLDQGFFDMQRAIMALDYVAREGVTLDNALVQLGWTIRTRLRTE
jgi:hypothetical protein